MNITQFFGRYQALPARPVAPPPVAPAVIGSNNPPGPIEFADETRGMISTFLADHPIIETTEDAKKAAALETQGLRALQEMEAERTKRVKPLNDEVAEINDSYKPASIPLKKTRDELTARINDYQKAEKAKREAIAAEMRRQADEKIRIAEEAARREREALENASAGEVGVEVGDVVADTDAAIREAEKAARQATIAERDTAVRINQGWGKSRGMREAEILTVTDPVKAIEAIGLTEGLEAAIKTAARAYRTMRKELPPGVISNKSA